MCEILWNKYSFIHIDLVYEIKMYTYCYVIEDCTICEPLGKWNFELYFVI